jgi:hypothetical protein
MKIGQTLNVIASGEGKSIFWRERMNERILALAKECGLCDEDGDFYGAKNTAYERFAELIVRECSNLPFKSTGEVTTIGEIAVSNMILKHFGVE